MTTITIPKELTKSKELVAVPRRLYDEFIEWQEKVKSARTFKPTAAEKRAVARARKNFKHGKYITLAQLKHELGTRSR